MTNDLFIVHARADLPWVEGYLLPALDLLPNRVLTPRRFEPGIPLVTAFEQAIGCSRYTILILTPAFLADEWTQFSDQLTSYARVADGQPRMIPLYLKPCTLPLHLDFLVRFDCTLEANWASEVSRLRELLSQPQPIIQNIPCPYPGMVPFSAMDSVRFFGREQEIGDLRHKLRHHNLLLVIGPSGSGKSSLVFAGLAAELERQDQCRWHIRSMRPGASPCDALNTTIGDLINLQTSPPTYPQGSHSTLLLIIDQFEEIFVQAPRSEQDAFIAALKSLCLLKSCKLVLTLRADFFPDLMNSTLWPVDSSQRAEIAPLRGDALRRAIEQPATNVGVYLEPGLVERLLADAADEPGVLPLLQETMVLLWEQQTHHFLPLSAYERVGGVGVAIATEADAAFARLAPAQQALARRIFLRLVQFGEGRPDTRRQQPVANLHSAGDGEGLLKAVLDHLANNRLLTLTTDALGQTQCVDLSHEKLITCWPQLQAWVKERKDSEIVRRRLDEHAMEWQRLGRGDGGLLDKAELREAEQWLQSSAGAELGISSDLLALLDASRRAINPGWHPWGTLWAAAALVALSAIVAWILVWIENNRMPGTARLMTVVFFGLLGVSLLWAFVQLRRTDPHMLEQLTHSLVQSSRYLTAVAALLAASIALWLIYGIQVIAVGRICGDLGYNKDTGALTVAVINDSADPLGAEAFVQTLNVASMNQIIAHLMGQSNAIKCADYFGYRVILRASTSQESREASYTAEIEQSKSGQLQSSVQMVGPSGCRQYGWLGFKVVSNLGFLPTELDVEPKLPAPTECAPYLAFLNAHQQVYQYRQYSVARAPLERLVQQYPNYAEAHAILGFVYSRTRVGLYDRAVAELRQAVSLAGMPYVPFLHSLAIACYRAGDSSCAEKASLDLIAENPNYIGGYIMLSTVYGERGKWTQAKDMLDRSEALVNALSNEDEQISQRHVIATLRGILAVHKGSWRDAIDFLQEADSLDSQLSEEIAYYIALSYQEIGDASRACQSWDRYRRIPPGELFREDERRQDSEKRIKLIGCVP